MNEVELWKYQDCEECIKKGNCCQECVANSERRCCECKEAKGND